MAILSIRHAPDPILKTTLRPITAVTPELRQLARDMIDTMYATGGIGLAANQVGQPWQLFVASPQLPRGEALVLMNPVIVSRRGRLRVEEGCLSLPGIGTPTRRAAIVQIRAMTLDGATREFEGHDLLARIFQHEIDHLHGVLFIDRLPLLTRRRLLRQYERQQQELARVKL